MAERAVRTYYDVLARTYDRRWGAYMDSTLTALLAEIRWPPGARVLDIGCGTGTLLARIAARDPAAHLTGVDASRGMLRVARRKLRGRASVRLIHGRAEQLPVGDAGQDLVTCASMLHYALRPSSVGAEARRVLRPGGLLAIIDYLPRYLHGSLVDGLIRHLDPEHVRSRGPRELAAGAARAGFTDLRVCTFPIDGWFRGVLLTGTRP